MKGKVYHGTLSIHHRAVPSTGTRSSRYQGQDHPGALSARGGPGVLGNLDEHAPPIDPPMPYTREMPHPDAMSKVEEIEHADPTEGLGVRPRGTLER